MNKKFNCKLPKSVYNQYKIERYLMQKCPEWVEWAREVGKRSRKVL